MLPRIAKRLGHEMGGAGFVKTGKADMKPESIAILFLVIPAILYSLAGCSSIGRMFLFYPSHRPHDNNLTPWMLAGEVIGYGPKVEAPRNVWLLLHGNAGQASDRMYALPSFSSEDAVHILEYPGYGDRKGTPSQEAFNAAAKEAYFSLRETYPRLPVCVAAESIGSGPASFLASLSPAPDKLVLIVPFDRLSLVAQDYFPSFLVRLFLNDDWDNAEALSHYHGPVEIVGAQDDTIIPVRHAKALAAAVPGAKLFIIEGGHNDWSHKGRVRIRNEA